MSSADPEAKFPHQELFDSYGFPPFAKATHLCGKRVYEQGGGHLTWDAFSSIKSPKALVALYKRRLGKRGFVANKGTGGSWKLPADSPAPSRVLSIQSRKEPGPHRACDRVPAKGDRSVVILSRR